MTETPGDTTLTLTREYKNEEISIDLTVSDQVGTQPSHNMLLFHGSMLTYVNNARPLTMQGHVGMSFHACNLNLHNVQNSQAKS